MQTVDKMRELKDEAERELLERIRAIQAAGLRIDGVFLRQDQFDKEGRFLVMGVTISVRLPDRESL